MKTSCALVTSSFLHPEPCRVLLTTYYIYLLHHVLIHWRMMTGFVNRLSASPIVYFKRIQEMDVGNLFHVSKCFLKVAVKSESPLQRKSLTNAGTFLFFLFQRYDLRNWVCHEICDENLTCRSLIKYERYTCLQNNMHATESGTQTSQWQADRFHLTAQQEAVEGASSRFSLRRRTQALHTEPLIDTAGRQQVQSKWKQDRGQSGHTQEPLDIKKELKKKKQRDIWIEIKEVSELFTAGVSGGF